MQISNNGCIDTSACYGSFVTGISEADTFAIELYPNPTSGTVHLNVPEAQDEIHLKIFNMLGEVILDETFYDTRTLVFELDQSRGIYLVEVTVSGTITRILPLLKN